MHTRPIIPSLSAFSAISVVKSPQLEQNEALVVELTNICKRGPMSFTTTSLQNEIIETAHSLVPIFAERASEHDQDNTFPYQNYEDLKRVGYHTLTVPKEFGGQGAGLLDLCLGQEELATGDASTALGIGMHLSSYHTRRA